MAEFSGFVSAYLLPHIGLAANGWMFHEYKNNLHPLFSGKLLNIPAPAILRGENWQEYDPWFGYRNNHNFKKGVLATDAFGFISNGDIKRDISKKEQGTYRIFILGGSTIAGVGIKSAEKSITAQLEQMLNASPNKNRPHFQVINAGTIGWYSPHEVVFSQLELLYYKPDMIINFDGVNDMLIANFKTHDTKNKSIERYYIHPYQGDLSKELVDKKLSNKLFRFAWANSKYNPARYSYFLHFIFYGIPRLFAIRKSENIKTAAIDKLRDMYPEIPSRNWYAWRNIVGIANNWKKKKHIENLPALSNVDFADRFVKNLNNMRAICEANNVKYMAILQPILLHEYKQFFPKIEKFYYDCVMQTFFNYHNKNYRLSALNYYKLSANLAKDKMSNDFVDFSKIFYSEKENLYYDWVHYNARGNKVIASKMKKLIESKLLCLDCQPEAPPHYLVSLLL